MGWWLLRLTVNILAFLRLTVNFLHYGYHPHPFAIRILSSAFFYLPSAAIWSPLYGDPTTLSLEKGQIENTNMIGYSPPREN